MNRTASWHRTIARHRDAVHAYATAAASVPLAAWEVPRQAGKWSPAEVTQHLILAFEAMEHDLRDGVPMQLRLKGWQRAVARLIYMRRILRDGAFPRGARAPREARPNGVVLPQDMALTTFRRRAAEVEQLAIQLHESWPDTRLTHPYFGQVTLQHAVFISAKHIEHHRADVAPSAIASAGVTDA